MEQAVLSIYELIRALQQSLEDDYGSVTVRGEISNFVHHSSGHRYFTLKDDKAQVKAVMWRSSPLRFNPTNGMNVIARGKMTVYPPQGAMQIECRSLEAAGLGDLQLAFEALKKELHARGWFDSGRKRPLPRFPKRIGVITSPTGAAIRDILSTLQRRMPLCEVIVRPAIVQGAGAPEDLHRAILEMQNQECDILIVGRGGGSIEDLWAFNTELVAAAIVQSLVPVISAVGHETDYTIADFVADVRAATPTAAAELAVRDQSEIHHLLTGTMEYFSRQITQHLLLQKAQLERFTNASGFRLLRDRIRQHQQTIDHLETRLTQHIQRNLQLRQQQVFNITQHCTSLYPLAPLQKGFALLKRGETIIRTNEVLIPDEILTIVRHNDQYRAIVQKKMQQKDRTGNNER